VSGADTATPPPAPATTRPAAVLTGLADSRLSRRLLRINGIGNLLGAVLTFVYFRFVDMADARESGMVTPFEIVYFIAGFAVIAAVGYVYGIRWARPIIAARTGAGLDPEVRRRAILLPYTFAGITLVGWVVAGLMWGVLWPLVSGHFSLGRSLRSIVGITGIAGTVTTAFIFFAIERQWRLVLPRFFPEGMLSAASPSGRLSVRGRLLLAFLVVSIVPLSALGVVSYTRAAALLRADPMSALALVDNLLMLVVFITAMGALTAATISVLVAGSVGRPLAMLQDALAAVEHGQLDTRCLIVASDETGALAEGFNRMVQGLQDRERLRDTFGKYVTPEIRDEIMAGRLSLEGKQVEATILFADLREFTPWVEASDPREVVRDLNAYFTEMEAAIRRHGGLVLQYIGDEIEAVFGAPVPDAEHADHAVQAAIEMRARLHAWNAERRRRGAHTLRHGIGVHTGAVLAATIGSSERLSYALVGDAVNLASRIQGLSKDLRTDILVSDSTRRRLHRGYALEPQPAVRVKGKSMEVEVFALGNRPQDTPGAEAFARA
jgi:class 3 adenylate cyclase